MQANAPANEKGREEKNVKTLVQLSVLPALGFAVFSGDVQAVTASADFCKAIAPSSNQVYSAMGFANLEDPPNGVAATCIIPTDAALGPSVIFQLRVFDNDTTQEFSCSPAVHDEMGNDLLQNDPPSSQTTGVSFVGSATLNWTVTLPGPNVNTNTYAIFCTMPGNFSTIYSASAL